MTLSAEEMAERLCKPNIFGLEHCWHPLLTTREAKKDHVVTHEICCWCGRGRETKHGLHLPDPNVIER